MESKRIFLSNGPGDPEPLVLVQELAMKIIEKTIHSLVFA